MKTKLAILLCLAAFVLAAAPGFAPKPVSPRSVKLEKRSIALIKGGKVCFQLYVPRKAAASVRKGSAEFAALLSDIAGTKVTITHVPPEKGQTALRYGDAAFAAEKKIDLSAVDRDGYVLAAFGNQILIAGNDALKDGKGKGTQFAGFEFLERFGDVRFYFPGKHGTLLPRKKDWQVPAMTIYDRPDNQFRQVHWRGPGLTWQKWYEAVKNQPAVEEVHRNRLRCSNITLPNCHGLAAMGYVKRFAKTHPEYFSVKPNGQRADGTVVRVPSDRSGHLCFSSGIMEEIYLDAKAVLEGAESVKKRKMTGASHWMTHCKPFFNLMPNDSMGRCRCEKCWPHFTGLSEGGGYTEKGADFLWNRLLTIPRRLKKEGVPGYVTMMAYDLCRNVPKEDIPDNVVIQVAHTGAWKEYQPESQRKDEKILQEWVKKIGSKIYLWNYSTKHNVRMLPDVPNFTPRAIGSYYKRIHKYSFGAFLEAESDYWLFGHLNFYVFFKVMWNNETDVDALLDDYRKRMFGAGAAPMKEIMEFLEETWLKRVVGNTVETSIGPASTPPSEHKLWTEIFCPKNISRIEALFDKAEKLAKNDKAALERIQLMRKELWGYTAAASKAYFKKAASVEHWKSPVGMLKKGEKIVIDGKGDETAWKNAPEIALLPLKKNEAEVLTFVKLLADDKYLYFLADCREPFTGKMRREKRPFDHAAMWMDNSLEFHLDPEGKRKTAYQIIVDSWGGIADLYNTPGRLENNWKWNSGAVAKTTVVPGKGWYAEVRIPRSSMKNGSSRSFAANFNRHRVIDGVQVHPFYTWSPYVLSFGNLANFGTIELGGKEGGNLLTDPDFKVTGIRNAKGTSWFNWGPLPWRDEKCFRTAGVAMRLEGKRTSLVHKLPQLKADTAYRFSFFVRQDNVKLAPGKKSGGFYVRFDEGNGSVRYLPKHSYYGSIPWIRWEFNFRTSKKKPGKAYLHFTLRNSTGRVWVDHVELTEVPDPGKK